VAEDGKVRLSWTIEDWHSSKVMIVYVNAMIFQFRINHSLPCMFSVFHCQPAMPRQMNHEIYLLEVCLYTTTLRGAGALGCDSGTYFTSVQSKRAKTTTKTSPPVESTLMWQSPTSRPGTVQVL